MTKHLLQIHIGPMQVFIAAARRTRDLWFGSWLMSELSKAAAREVAKQAGEDKLIFPAATLSGLSPKSKSDLAVANKIVALVENPKYVAEEAEKAMRKRLTELGKIALDGAKGPLQTRTTAEEQIDDLPEFYWVAVPLLDESDYLRVRMEAENLLAARKNCRNFEQPDWGSNRPKSSLDGSRESVIPESAYLVRGDSPKRREEKIRALYDNYRARNAEQLSGVDLLKRLGKSKDRESFPSTSHMASIPLRQRLQNANGEIKKAWDAYKEQLDPELIRGETTTGTHPVFGNADGALLFESRLRDYYEGKDFEKIKAKLADFYKKTQIPRPIPYYAILMADGDFIGKTINNLKTQDAHRNFSQALAGFAQEAKKIVKDHQGAPVYTGGDDVLALLPLHKAIQCAAKLAEEFRSMMAGFKDKDSRPPTFSAGLAIFHHTEPLEDGLNTARDAEKEAKAVPGKDALAVIEAKRSGAPRLVTGKWGELNTRLLGLAAFYQQGDLPHGLAYQLRDMYLHLGGETAVSPTPAWLDVIKKEAGRIVKRKEGSENARKYVENHLVGKLGENYIMEQIVNELIIATNLAQAANQAGITLPVP